MNRRASYTPEQQALACRYGYHKYVDGQCAWCSVVSAAWNQIKKMKQRDEQKRKEQLYKCAPGKHIWEQVSKGPKGYVFRCIKCGTYGDATFTDDHVNDRERENR